MMQGLLLLIGLPAAWVVLTSTCLLLAYRRSLYRLWCEPVLKAPVLIVESDDWGAGTLDQAPALERLRQQLQKYRDARGRHPVITLALVLAGPDRPAMRAALDKVSAAPLPHSGPRYCRRTLADPVYRPLLEQIRQGEAEGVFAAQLHGMEHYWPDALLTAATTDSQVGAWLTREEAETEELPSPLQSRWTDAGSLPSRPIAPERLQRAVVEEVSLYRELFGRVPAVVVPPTFVWNRSLEAAWAGQGVQVVVTPGRRWVGRDREGRLVGDRARLLADEAGAGGVRYQVRDAYFEPAWGHGAERGVAALSARSRLGRATLLETHRFNFLRQPDASHRALDQLLTEALARFPGLQFLSTQALAEGMSARDPELVETRLGQRLRIWCRRVDELPGFRRLSRLSGFALITWVARSGPTPATVWLPGSVEAERRKETLE